MKRCVFLATKSTTAEIDAHVETCYVLTFKKAICSIDPYPSSMPLVGTNILHEFEDVFPTGNPPWMPSLQGI